MSARGHVRRDVGRRARSLGFKLPSRVGICVTLTTVLLIIIVIGAFTAFGSVVTWNLIEMIPVIKTVYLIRPMSMSPDVFMYSMMVSVLLMMMMTNAATPSPNARSD